jgi:hypothetical protein
VTDEELCQRAIDEEQLRLLSLCYKVMAGVTAFYSLFGLGYILIGVTAELSPVVLDKERMAPPPLAFFAFFGGFGLAILVLGLAVAGLKIAAARRLEEYRSLGFCQFVAAISCLEIPYGTFFGVLTFIALSRPSVRQLFGQAAQKPLPAADDSFDGWK